MEVKDEVIEWFLTAIKNKLTFFQINGTSN